MRYGKQRCSFRLGSSSIQIPVVAALTCFLLSYSVSANVVSRWRSLELVASLELHAARWSSLLELVEACWSLLEYVGAHWTPLELIGVRGSSLQFVGARWSEISEECRISASSIQHVNTTAVSRSQYGLPNVIFGEC